MSIARETALRQNAGVIAQYLYPVQNEREMKIRQGIKPKDHHRDNVLALRQLQETRRAKEEENQLQAEKELFKMPRFLSVESKVKTEMLSPKIEDQRPSTAPGKLFLRAHGKTRMPDPPDPSSFTQRKPRIKPPVPTRAQTAAHALLLDDSKQKSNSDFIRANALTVINARKVKEVEDENEPVWHALNPEYGRVPEYLIHRRETIRREREQQRIQEQHENIPEGYKLLSEEERLETLETLKTARAERIRDMQRQHLVLHTASQIQYANDLQNKLDEIDAAIKMFSKKRIIVKDNNAPLPARPRSAPLKKRWHS